MRHVNVSFLLLTPKNVSRLWIYFKKGKAGVQFRSITQKASKCQLTLFNSLFLDPFKNGDPHFNILSDVGKLGNLVSNLAAIT